MLITSFFLEELRIPKSAIPRRKSTLDSSQSNPDFNTAPSNRKDRQEVGKSEQAKAQNSSDSYCIIANQAAAIYMKDLLQSRYFVLYTFVVLLCYMSFSSLL